jgi:hypothetical protein
MSYSPLPKINSSEWQWESDLAHTTTSDRRESQSMSQTLKHNATHPLIAQKASELNQSVPTVPCVGHSRSKKQQTR